MPPSPSITGREAKGPSPPTGPSTTSHGRLGSCHHPCSTSSKRDLPPVARLYSCFPTIARDSSRSRNFFEHTSKGVTPVLKTQLLLLLMGFPPQPCHTCPVPSALPPCTLLSPVHALPISTHPCPLPGGLPPYPEGMTDAHGFRNEFAPRDKYVGAPYSQGARTQEVVPSPPPSTKGSRAEGDKPVSTDSPKRPSGRQEPAVYLAEHHRLCRLLFRRRQRSLAGYSPWGRRVSVTNQVT